MVGAFIILGGMVLFATLIGVMDLIARRQERQQRSPR